MTTADSMAALLGLVGEPFLRYVLAIDDVAQLQDPTMQTAGRQMVVTQLQRLLAPGELSQDAFGRQLELSHRLSTLTPAEGHSIANVFRQASGGALPTHPSTSDAVLKHLYTLLVEAYPSLLLPVPRGFGFGPRLGNISYNYAEKNELEAEILKDPALSLLFQSHTENGGWMGHILRSSGSGGSTQLWMFPDEQISNAWEHAKLRHSVPTVDQVADMLAHNLKLTRKAIAGKLTNVPMLVALTGVLLPESTSEIDLGFAKVRKATDGDRWLAGRTGIEGKLQTTTPDGQNVVIDYAGDLVLELPLPYEVVLAKWEPTAEPISSPWPEGLRKAQQRVEESLETVRLALLLALDSPTPTNIVTSWQVALDPLAGSLNPSWSDTRQVPNLVPRQLTEHEVTDWLEWVKRVHAHRSASIAVAIRRMLQAIAERRNPDDVLVDAVIVWENLFGATVETTLRVTSSMAWLLGSSADDRVNKQRAYKVIYAARSGIVHGSSKAKLSQIPGHAQEAVRISRDALRAVFNTRSDLLKIKTSEERSLAILLGVESDPAPSP